MDKCRCLSVGLSSSMVCWGSVASSDLVLHRLVLDALACLLACFDALFRFGHTAAEADGLVAGFDDVAVVRQSVE